LTSEGLPVPAATDDRLSLATLSKAIVFLFASESTLEDFTC